MMYLGVCVIVVMAMVYIGVNSNGVYISDGFIV